MLRPQITRSMRAHAAATIARRLAEDHELRQVLVERSQAVMHPRADRRQITVEHVPAGVELQDGAMIVVGGVHRADQRHFVDHRAHVGPPVGDLRSALAILAVTNLHRVKRQLDAVIAFDEFLDTLDVGRIQRVFVRRLRDVLARVFVERRLGIEGVHVADAAQHEQPDHAFRFRREVGLAIGRSPGVSRRGGLAVALEHRAEHQPGKTHAAVRQKHPAARRAAAGETGQRISVDAAHRISSLPHRMVTKSVWFRSTCTRSSRARR